MIPGQSRGRGTDTEGIYQGYGYTVTSNRSGAARFQVM
jgi:hypothetical protein